MTIAGLHTKKAAVKFIEEKTLEYINKYHRDYLMWPTKAIFLPRSWKDDEFLYALIALGSMDNESLQLQVSFIDRACKARSIFQNMFKNEIEYKQATQEQKNEFGQRLEMTLVLPAQTAGSFRALVSVNESVWNLFLMIILNDYIKAEEVEKARLANRPYKPRKTAPLQSGATLVPFLGLPTPTIVALLDAVTTGKMSLNAAKNEAILIKSYQKLVSGFERIANIGIDKSDKKYVTYNEFRLNHPKLAQALEATELKRFSMTGRSGVDENAFQAAVKRVLAAANIIQGGHDGKVETLKDLLNSAAERQLEEKVTLINTSQSSIMCINCKTEDLPSYFKIQARLKVGMIYIFYIFESPAFSDEFI